MKYDIGHHLKYIYLLPCVNIVHFKYFVVKQKTKKCNNYLINMEVSNHCIFQNL